MKTPKDFKHFFIRYVLEHRGEFRGKTVVDMPAGTGVTSRVLKEIGSVVLPFDLFPEYFKVDGLKCRRANVMEGMPLKSRSVDVVICQEGIEHFSDQLKALREFNRILKLRGILILTTPNYSNLRAKLSYLLSESERFGSLMAPNELDSIWMSSQKVSKEVYFGHIFLIGIQKLRVLAKVSGFKIRRINSETVKPTSLLLFPLLYPFIFLSNLISYRRNLTKNPDLPMDAKRQVYGEVFRLGINPKILVQGSLFLEFEKEFEVSAIAQTLRGRHQSFDVPT